MRRTTTNNLFIRLRKISKSFLTPYELTDYTPQTSQRAED